MTPYRTTLTPGGFKMMKWMKKAAVLAVVAAVCFAAGACAQTGAGEMAQVLLNAEKNGAPTPALSKEFGTTDIALAYKVQNAYVQERLKTETLAGYKGALTAEPLMKKFSATEPATAALFASGEIAQGGVIVLDRKGIMLEEEIGFRFGRKISAPVQSVEELKGCIRTVFPAIEVPLVAFASLAGVNAFDMAAANIGSWGYIVGKEVPYAGQDLNTVEVKMTCNGELFNAGKGSDALGDQWNALLWIVNNVVKQGGVIEEGHIVISGAMGAMKPAKPGAYVADFGAFGSIAFEAKAK